MSDRQNSDPQLCEAVTHLVGLLVDETDEVFVAEEVSGSSTVFAAQVEDDDLGKLIGRQGRTARSLRAFLDVRGTLDDQRYGLEIREY